MCVQKGNSAVKKPAVEKKRKGSTRSFARKKGEWTLRQKMTWDRKPFFQEKKKKGAGGGKRVLRIRGTEDYG